MPEKILPVVCVIIYVVAASVGAMTGGLWAALGIGLAAILFFCLWGAGKKDLLPPRHFAFFALAVLAIFAAELPLSSHFAVSFHVWAQLLSVFLPLLLLTSPVLQNYASSKFFVPVVAFAAFLGAIALGLELRSGGAFLHMFKKPDASLTEYNRGIAHLVILAFPLFAGLWIAGAKRAVAILALALLFPAGLTESHTAKLALIVGMICAAAAFYRPVWVRRTLALTSIALMGWPFYARAVFSADYGAVEQWHNSWRHRMEIWDYLSYRISERPSFGWGLGTTHLLDFTRPHGNLYAVVISGAPHAHNFVTELWVETGFLGLIFGLVFMLWSLRAADRMHASLRPFALGGWACAVIVAMFGFDFWTDALWAAFALTAFAFGMLNQRIERRDHIADA